jgi:hypothetical protein
MELDETNPSTAGYPDKAPKAEATTSSKYLNFKFD